MSICVALPIAVGGHKHPLLDRFVVFVDLSWFSFQQLIDITPFAHFNTTGSERLHRSGNLFHASILHVGLLCTQFGTSVTKKWLI